MSAPSIRVLLRPLATAAVLLGLVFSVSSSEVGARAPLPPNITGPISVTLGGSYSHIFAMSQSGYVVGTSTTPGDAENHRFLRKPDGTIFDLGINNWDGGYVSNNGFVTAVNSLNNAGQRHAQFWSEDTGWLDIPGVPQPINGTIDPTDWAQSMPSGVNSSGMVVGLMWSERPGVGSSNYRMFAWTRAGGIVDLGTNGADSIDIAGINELGQIAGTISYYTSGQSDHGFRWSAAEGFVDLGALPGQTPRLRPFAMSEAGQVVGFEYFPTVNQDHAISWTPAGGLVDLFSVNSQYNYAQAVNARGNIAGSKQVVDSFTTPFFMTSATSPVQLLNPGAYGSVSRNGINGFGQVAGGTYFSNGAYQQRAFYWSQADGYVDLGGGNQADITGISNGGMIAGNLNYLAAIWQVTPEPAPGDDVTPPTIALTGVVDGATYTMGQSVVVNYTCSDDAEVVACAAPVASGSLLDTMTPGPHTFTVTAIDRNDNVTTKTVHYRTPDTTGPAIFTSFEDGAQLVVDTQMPLNARCDDAGGVASCVATDETGHVIGFFDGVNASAGDHTITVVGTDKSGNTTTKIIRYNAAADTFGPVIAVSSPVQGAIYAYGETVQVSFNCTDPSGVSQCGPGFDNGSGYSSGSTFQAFTGGAHTFTVTAVDGYGNSTTKTVTYTVLAGPSVTIASPVSGATYHIGDAVNASYTCTASNGVASCDANVNGNSVASGSALDTTHAGTFPLFVTVTDSQGYSVSAQANYVVLANDAPPVALPTPPPGGFLGPVNIGSLGGGYTNAVSVSSNGIVTGTSNTETGSGHAFVWTQAGGMKDLGDFSPNQVSSNGTVIGAVTLPSPPNQIGIFLSRAVAWTPAGGLKQLTTLNVPIDDNPLPSDYYGGSYAQYVNASGLIAGYSTSWRVSMDFGSFKFYGAYQFPTIWKPTGEAVIIPKPAGVSSFNIIGLTDAGQVVLQVYTDTGYRGLLWTEAGGFVDIGDLGGGWAMPTSSSASGYVVGQSADADGSTQSFRWSASTGMQTIVNSNTATPSAVGTSGQVLLSLGGPCCTSATWNGGALTTLPDLGLGNGGNGFVNGSGQILGDAFTSDGSHHAGFWNNLAISDLGPIDGINGLSDNHLAVGSWQGNVMVWTVPGFTADSTAPAISIASPLGGGTIAQNSAATASYTCSDAVGVSSCIGDVANGAPINTSATGTFPFTVTTVDASGNITTKTVHYTVATGGGNGGGSTPGHMHGEGRIKNPADANERQRFAFDVLERPTGQHHLRFNFWTVDPDDSPRRTNVFDATSITEVHFSDDPAFRSGSAANAPAVDSVTFKGTGAFNGQGGFTFEVRATDQGEPGTDRDTLSLTVKDGTGAVVFTASGVLDSGNIQSLRLPNRHFPPFLSGGPERVREVEAAGPSGTVVTFSVPTAVDENGNSLTVTCLPASGSTFPLGRTRGTCTAADANGRKGSMVFVVVVSDNIAPVFTSPLSNMTVEATGPQGASAIFALPSAHDAVDSSVDVTCNKASGSVFHFGATVVTCRAKDNAGNRTDASFTVTVVDTTSPVFIGAAANITAEATAPTGRKVTYTKPEATDAADSSVAVVCTPASGSTFARGTTTVACTATDNAGNTASTSFTVTIVDTTVPTITLSKPSQGAEYKLGQSVIANYSCKDDGSGIASCVGTVADGAALNTSTLGTKTFTVTATDLAGNTVTKSVTYVVKPR